MDQIIFASLSHTHYWYEVGMLKIPAVDARSVNVKNTHRQRKRKRRPNTGRGRGEEADKIEVAPGVTVASLRRFRAALIGPIQGLPK